MSIRFWKKSDLHSDGELRRPLELSMRSEMQTNLQSGDHSWQIIDLRQQQCQPPIPRWSSRIIQACVFLTPVLLAGSRLLENYNGDLFGEWLEPYLVPQGRMDGVPRFKQIGVYAPILRNEATKDSDIKFAGARCAKVSQGTPADVEGSLPTWCSCMARLPTISTSSCLV